MGTVTKEEANRVFDLCTQEKPKARKPDLEVTVLPPQTAVERTLAAVHGKWAGNAGRINQARAFVKRATKSDQRRKLEKQSRKRNRRRK